MGQDAPALGIYAKSAAGRPDKGEFDRRRGVHGPGQHRRWKLHRQAARLFKDIEARPDRYGEPRAHFRYRVAMCCRGTTGQPPTIRRSPDGNRADYHGLQRCGSVWICPLCAPKIAARRRDEGNIAIARWGTGHQGETGGVYFLTFTFQHDRDTGGEGQLKAQLGRLADALRRLKGTRAYRALMDRISAKGEIRALEVTYGEFAGWHPHSHAIVFCRRQAMPELRKLRGLWARELIARGLAGLELGDIGVDRFRKLRHLLLHCFQVQPGAFAADYLAKFGREPEGERGRWSLSAELTHGHLKRGRGDRDGTPSRCEHASMWELLNDALDGDRRSADLFREFGEAFHGRRQLYWSKGLRAFFGIDELEDEAIAAEPDRECTEHVIQLDTYQWANTIAHDARHDVLCAAASGGRQAVLELLAELATRAPPYSGYYTEAASWEKHH